MIYKSIRILRTKLSLLLSPTATLSDGSIWRYNFFQDKWTQVVKPILPLRALCESCGAKLKWN